VKSMNRQSRRGSLLLDMIVAMTMTIVVLSTSSIWVYKTMQYSSKVRQRDLHARGISRISRQLRSDAREASSISAEGDQLVIKTPRAQTITYTIKANRLHRESSVKLPTIANEDLSNSGNPTAHQDDFDFANNAKLNWSLEQSSGTVSLDIGRDFSHLSASKKKTTKGLDAQILISIPEDSQ